MGHPRVFPGDAFMAAAAGRARKSREPPTLFRRAVHGRRMALRQPGRPQAGGPADQARIWSSVT